MTDRDRPTPPDAFRAAKGQPPPRPERPGTTAQRPQRRAESQDDPEAVRELDASQEALRARQRALPPPLPGARAPEASRARQPERAEPVRQQQPERHRTPESGGMPLPGSPVASPKPIRVETASLPPPASSVPAEADRQLGRAVRKLLGRHWKVAATVLGIGGGTAGTAVAVWPTKPSVEARVEVLEAQRDVATEALRAVLKREAVKDAYLDCLHEQQAERFAQLFPAQDKASAATLPKPWIDACSKLKPKP